MLLMVNVDDISGELVPHAIDSLMARGAQSVHVVPAFTKKGRPEFIFFVDAPEGAVSDLTRWLTAELGTLGVKIIGHDHVPARYHMCKVRVECPEAARPEPLLVGVKCVEDAEGRTVHVKAEFEDVRAVLAAWGDGQPLVSFQGLKALVEMVAANGQPGRLGGVSARPAGD